MKTDAFALRHIGTGEKDLNHMLKTIGVDSVDQLIYETIPAEIRLKNELNLEKPMTEYEYLNHIQELGKKNKVFICCFTFFTFALVILVSHVKQHVYVGLNDIKFMVG